MDYFVDAFRKAFDFQGRANRMQYWMFVLVVFIVSSILILGWEYGGQNLGPILGFVYAIWILVLFIPSLSIMVRRLHDTGRSGWWVLISFLPIIGGIWLLILLVLPTKN